MTDERQPTEPNQAGFSGEPATPEPERTGTSPEASPEAIDGEDVAVPAGDLTGALTDAITPDTRD